MTGAGPEVLPEDREYDEHGPGCACPWHYDPGREADPHEHDWAGPGFTKPGPEPDAGHQAWYSPGKAEAPAGTTTISDRPATSLTGRRHVRSSPVRRIGAEGR